MRYLLAEEQKGILLFRLYVVSIEVIVGGSFVLALYSFLFFLLCYIKLYIKNFICWKVALPCRNRLENKRKLYIFFFS